jgi:hypothetical protein
MLQQAAACGGGLFAASSDASALSAFYSKVAANILQSSTKSQTIIINGSLQQSILYPDSYLWFSHRPAYPALRNNEVTVTAQTPQFGSCSPVITLNPSTRVVTADLASYSGAHWTDTVTSNGNTAYSLLRYGAAYGLLGDPYIVSIQPNYMIGGTNTITVQTGDAPGLATGCSVNDSIILNLGIQLSTLYTPVLTSAQGCRWTIEHDDGTTQTLTVPSSYRGTNTCSYTHAGQVYNHNDAYDVATFGLLTTIDFDRDGRTFVSLSDQDIEIAVNAIKKVPYLWGPSLFEVRAWQ